VQSTKIPSLRIGGLEARIPIVQGGMSVGISLSGLAAAVANEGGIGVISAEGIGMLEPDFKTNFREANKRTLSKESTGGIRWDHRREYHGRPLRLRRSRTDRCG